MAGKKQKINKKKPKQNTAEETEKRMLGLPCEVEPTPLYEHIIIKAIVKYRDCNQWILFST